MILLGFFNKSHIDIGTKISGQAIHLSIDLATFF